MDKSICPLCGRQNNCGAEKGLKQCWCYGVIFSEELKNKIPKNSQQKGCICLYCVMEASVKSKDILLLHTIDDSENKCKFFIEEDTAIFDNFSSEDRRQMEIWLEQIRARILS